MPPIKENRLFLGNPGTGKSTLINCIVGRQVFKSGLAWGSGLTQKYQKYEVDGVTYMDTPGLADREILQQAAAAIKQALSEPGRYKLFFMVRLQAGRVVSDDMVTVERVLDAIKLDDVPFAILINNLPKRQYSTLIQLGEEFEKVAACINNGKYTTPYIFFIPKFEDLDDEDNAIIQLPQETTTFIAQRAPAIDIPRGVVSDINIHNYAHEVEALKEMINQLVQDRAMMMETLQKMQEKYRDEIASEREYHRQQVERYAAANQRKQEECSIL